MERVRPPSTTGSDEGGDRTRPRIAPGAPGQLGPLARAVARVAGRATGGEPQRVFTTLGRHRRLFRWWVPFAGTLLLRTSLPRRDIELLVLRTALNCSSAYEWVQHVPLARAAGLRLEEVRAVADLSRGDVPKAALTARQRLLVEAADELHSRKVIGDPVWRALADELDECELIELCMLVGHYEMLAMALNSLGVQPEPSALAALDDDSHAIWQDLEEKTHVALSGLASDGQDADAHPVGEPPSSIAPT